MGKRTDLIRVMVGMALALSLASRVLASDDNSGLLAGIQISFKLDPRLSGATYGGERWVSPKTFQGATAQDTVDARARGVDPKGRLVSISPTWVPSDPELVSVSPVQGDSVRIMVRRAGESRLTVSSAGVSRELTVKAELRNGRLLVEIRQDEGGTPASAPGRPTASDVRRGAGPAADVRASHHSSEAGKALSAVEIADRNRRDGEAFLEANRKKEGVVTLESGLQYRILKAGGGRKPAVGDIVLCQYRGTFIDGTEFASSYKRKRPARFPVGGISDGWREVFQLMPIGSRWQLFVPAKLAYGERGLRRARIGPNMALIFDVELLAIKPKTGGGASRQGDPVTDAGAPAETDLRPPG